MGWSDDEIDTLHKRAMDRRRKGERMGQSYYNAAYSMNPGVAHLAGTNLDPFYIDERLGLFLAALRGEGKA